MMGVGVVGEATVAGGGLSGMGEAAAAVDMELVKHTFRVKGHHKQTDNGGQERIS